MSANLYNFPYDVSLSKYQAHKDLNLHEQAGTICILSKIKFGF